MNSIQSLKDYFLVLDNMYGIDIFADMKEESLMRVFYSKFYGWHDYLTVSLKACVKLFYNLSAFENSLMSATFDTKVDYVTCYRKDNDGVKTYYRNNPEDLSGILNRKLQECHVYLLDLIKCHHAKLKKKYANLCLESCSKAEEILT